MPKKYSVFYHKFCFLNFPALGQGILLKLFDTGIHFEIQKEKLVISGVEWEPLVTLFFSNTISKYLLQDSFWHIFWAMRKIHHTY